MANEQTVASKQLIPPPNNRNPHRHRQLTPLASRVAYAGDGSSAPCTRLLSVTIVHVSTPHHQKNTTKAGASIGKKQNKNKELPALVFPLNDQITLL